MDPLTKNDVIALYEKFKFGGDGTIHPVRKYFGLPECDWCVRMAHKLWAKIMSCHSHYTGHGHLNNSKFSALGDMDLRTLNDMIYTITHVDINSIHNQMKAIDIIFSNTH